MLVARYQIGKRVTSLLLRAFVVTCLVAAPPSAYADAASFRWGVNGHPLVSYPGISDEAQIEFVADLKTGTYRIDVTDVAQIDHLSRITSIAKAHGVQILPVLVPPVNLEAMAPKDLYRAAYGFAETFAKRFSGDFPVWELGNELENFAILHPCDIRDDGTKYPCEWGPAGGVGPGEYEGRRMAKVTAVLRGLSDAVRTLAPGARRAIGTAGWGHTGAFQRFQDGGVEWDISVWHIYGQDPEWAFKALANFGKPIWVTEINHPFGSAKDGEEGQAQGLARQMMLVQDLASRYRVEAGFVYELLDEPYWDPSYEANMGLVKLQKSASGAWAIGSRKAAFAAVKHVTASATASEP